MTIAESECRDEQTRRRIECTLSGDNGLAQFADDLTVETCRDRVVISGRLPSPHLVRRIVPMVRRAGVLSQIDNQVVSA